MRPIRIIWTAGRGDLQSGVEFQIPVLRRMPLIPEGYLYCTAYLYHSEDAAQNGTSSGGSGFLISLTSDVNPDVKYVYVVTNRHVVKGGHAVARLYTVDNKPDIPPLGDWYYRDDADDIAICALGPMMPPYKYVFVPDTYCLDQTTYQTDLHVGPGDDVFMVGRLIGHDGKQRNTPSVRFGNVAMNPEEPVMHDGHLQYSFIVESRSIAGYSGSPVFLHIQPHNWRPNVSQNTGQWKHHLLGVDCGHMLIPEPLRDRRQVNIPGPWKQEQQGRSHESLYVRTNNGMMVVVPSWSLREMLNTNVLLSARKSYEEKLRQDRDAEPLIQPAEANKDPNVSE